MTWMLVMSNKQTFHSLALRLNVHVEALHDGSGINQQKYNIWKLTALLLLLHPSGSVPTR